MGYPETDEHYKYRVKQYAINLAKKKRAEYLRKLSIALWIVIPLLCALFITKKFWGEEIRKHFEDKRTEQIIYEQMKNPKHLQVWVRDGRALYSEEHRGN